jgi:hypothetical protein
LPGVLQVVACSGDQGAKPSDLLAEHLCLLLKAGPLPGKRASRRELSEVFVVPALAGHVALQPELLLSMVQVVDHGLRFGRGEGLGDADHRVKRQMDIAVTVAVRERMKIRGLGLSTGAIEDPLKLSSLIQVVVSPAYAPGSPVDSSTAVAASISALSEIRRAYSSSLAALSLVPGGVTARATADRLLLVPCASATGRPQAAGNARRCGSLGGSLPDAGISR